MPEVMPENQELFECFTLCDSQLRAGMGGAYAMDWKVVMSVAEAMEIEMDERFYRMLKVFEGALCEEMGKRTPEMREKDD